MTVIYNGTTLGAITYNGVSCKKVIYNGVEVFVDNVFLYSTGNNQYGQLGLNDRIYRSSPVQIGANKWVGVSAVGHNIAVLSNNTLWAWGINLYGALGTNNRIYRSSPVQVGALTNWTAQSRAGQYWSQAIKADGTLWAWGFNVYGQLGTGNTIYRSSPVQVGALSNWAKLATHNYSFASLAIKTDGTLWAWGNNNWGQLGLGDVANKSSPTQVGSGTNWTRVFGGGDHNIFGS